MNPEPANPNPPAASEPLQFDRAEFAQPAALNCAICKAPIIGEFFQANGQNICPACRDKVQAGFTGGSKSVRSAMALGAGLAAGVAGFLLYWVILTVFNWELGLIAIVVGWMVGGAVRWGSAARGGLFYQLMALVITYVSICSSYIPMIMKGAGDTSLPWIAKLIVSFFLALAAPWLEGPGNIIGWIIIAVGLYQAWIMNRKPNIQVTGPYSTAKPAPAP